jgi:serine/threonine protein kinase
MTNSEPPRALFDKKYCPLCYAIYESAIENCPGDGVFLRGSKNDPLIGKTFADRYEILSLVGVGGMSIVYQARHKLIGRRVAIKMMHTILRDDVLALERFKKEAQAASSLSHPNIITIYDFGVSIHGEPFLVMDYLDGDSLRDILGRQETIPYQRAVNIFLQICDGLGAAHEHGIVHRDLKPANIMLVPQLAGRDLVKILDFGIAKFSRPTVDDLHLTKAGEIFGSPIYMSPEQCGGKPNDARSDIYSFGCLMYEALTGEPPFKGDNVLDTMNMHVSAKFKPIEDAVPNLNIPEDLASIVEQCLAKDPLDRPQSCQEIATLLGMIPTRSGSAGQSSGKVSSARRRKKVALKVFGYDIKDVVLVVETALIFGTLAFFILWPGPEEDKGNLWDKVVFQILFGLKDQAIKNKDYSAAERILKQTQEVAAKMNDRQQRLENVLTTRRGIYNSWEGHAQQLETVNKAIIHVQDQRVVGDYEACIQMVEEHEKGASTPVADSSKKLRLEAQIARVLDCSSRLLVAGHYDEAEILMRRSIGVVRMLAPDDSLSLAAMEMKLGEIKRNARKLSEARAHILEAANIYRKWIKSHPCRLAGSLSRLSELDLDLGNFRESRAEAEEALKLSCKDDALLVTFTRRNYDELIKQTKRLGLYDQVFK